jgi:formylglycine-generating enzyme required for sulfatase activity
MRKSLLYWLACLSIVTGVVKGQTIVYQKSFPTNQSWSDTFQYAPPSDGKFILTIDNPDATYDGGIALLDGTEWYNGQNLIFDPEIRQGVQQSIFEMDVKQSWGLRPWLWLTNQTQNAGNDTLTLQFSPGSVSDQPKTYLGTLTSGPMEGNSAEWPFDLANPGKLLFNVTMYGSGGGSHVVYVDNVKIMELRLGWGNPGETAPDWSSVEVPAGQHMVRLAHEDDIWSDNEGVRQTDIYFVAIPTVISPNGGENWIAGTTKVISWETSDANAIPNVHIEYSTEKDPNWKDVNTVPNTGSYNWLVPQATSNQCLVRISDVNDANIFDVSDKVFTIFVCQLSSLGDLNKDCKVDFVDFAILAQDWLRNGNPFDQGYTEGPAGMVWVSINEPNFTGYISKYETTNAQYCQYLNAAKATGDIIVYGNDAIGASGSNSGEDFVGQVYYNLAGPGETFHNATNGGAARINYSGGVFSVDSGFENHPVTYVSWYGATAFCNYYGYRLPTDWEWQAVADHTVGDPYTYGCGTSINNSIANYRDSTHPNGTTVVGAFGTYGYGMCDMAGNVWEWTSSIYSGKYRVKSGCWSEPASHCTVSYWYDGGPYDSGYGYGFRVCR